MGIKDEISRGVYPAFDAGLEMTFPGAVVTMIFGIRRGRGA
jgi:hypothetical protein